MKNIKTTRNTQISSLAPASEERVRVRGLAGFPLLVTIAAGLLVNVTSGIGFLSAQEPAADPAAPSTIVQQTLAKIRDVEKLDKYIAENTALKTENTTMKTQLASLTLQVTQLTEQLKAENERLRKQMLELPNFTLKSKVLAGENAIAVLQLGEKSFRIRNNVEMSIPLSNGVWILMRVEKITKDVVELKFPEMDRTVVIYD